MLYYERKFRKKGKKLIIGVDEVGRGPLAGPVVAAAVFLKTFSFKNHIDDSKQLTCRQREKAFFEIVDKSVFGIGIINEKIIDRVNILESTRLAMEMAIDGLMEKISSPALGRVHVLVDGRVNLDIKFPFTGIIRGDSKSKSIACASILAKVTRDRIMDIYDKIFPQYGFSQHKGYPTQAHRNALKEYGKSIIHRVTFSGV